MEDKEIIEPKKEPFYKDKGFWKSVGKFIVNTGVAFGAAYLANMSRKR